jgi:hypothetical protein
LSKSVWVAGRELKFGINMRCLLTIINEYSNLEFFEIRLRVFLKNNQFLRLKFHNIITIQPNRHADNYSPAYQSGFWKHHSMVSSIKLRSNLEEEQTTILVLLDFSQAFDTVVQELAICKLSCEQNYSPESERLLGSFFIPFWEKTASAI